MSDKNRPIGIFLSHTWTDKDFSRKLAKDLSNAGAKVWFDEAEILVGDSLIEKISIGIESMDYLAVVLSPESVKSEWVRREVEIALNQEIRGKRVKVLPILYKMCDIPAFLLGKLHADFTDPSSYYQALRIVLMRLGLEPVDKIIKEYDIQINYRISEIFIEDVEGKKAIYREIAHLQALRDGIRTYVETFQSDGRIDSFYVEPGEIERLDNEEGFIYLYSNFGKVLKKGEKIERRLECIYHDTFVDEEGYWVRHPSDPAVSLKIILYFPKMRPYKSYKVTEKYSRYESVSKFKAVSKIIDERPCIVWDLKHPEPDYRYKLEWTW